MMEIYYETTISFNCIEFLPYVLFLVISLIFIGKLKKLYDLYIKRFFKFNFFVLFFIFIIYNLASTASLYSKMQYIAKIKQAKLKNQQKKKEQVEHRAFQCQECFLNIITIKRNHIFLQIGNITIRLFLMEVMLKSIISKITAIIISPSYLQKMIEDLHPKGSSTHLSFDLSYYLL